MFLTFNCISNFIYYYVYYYFFFNEIKCIFFVFVLYEFISEVLFFSIISNKWILLQIITTHIETWHKLGFILFEMEKEKKEMIIFQMIRYFYNNYAIDSDFVCMLYYLMHLGLIFKIE